MTSTEILRLGGLVFVMNFWISVVSWIALAIADYINWNNKTLIRLKTYVCCVVSLFPLALIGFPSNKLRRVNSGITVHFRCFWVVSFLIDCVRKRPELVEGLELMWILKASNFWHRLFTFPPSSECFCSLSIPAMLAIKIDLNFPDLQLGRRTIGN